jgi:hypothetical protein
MVVSHNVGGYAQSGTMYRWGYGSCVKRWAEQAATGPDWADYYLGGCSSVGDIRRYRQELVYDGSWHVRSYMDTTVIRQSSFNPLSTWTTPYGVQFEAETTYTASNVPGVQTYKQEYTAMQVQNWAGDGWVSACGNTSLSPVNESSRYDRDKPDCDYIRTWTK